MTTIDNAPSNPSRVLAVEQHSVAPEKTQGRLLTPSRLAFPAVLVLVGLVAQQWYRKTEATTAAGLANILGAHNIKSTGTPRLLVLPKTGSPFYALVSFGCSSLSVLLTFAVVALVVIRSSFRRRLLAAAIAVSILFVVNVGRVAGVAAVGSHYGLQTMSRVHDWFGTAVTLLGSVLAAGCVYLIAAMPSKQAGQIGRSNHSGAKVVV
jgi:exosortase/archaeosortase family protein